MCVGLPKVTNGLPKVTKATKAELTLRGQIYIEEKGCYDIQHNDIQHNITQHTGLVYDTQHK